MKAKRRLQIIAPLIALVLVGLVLLIPQRHVQLYKVTILPSLGGTRTRPEAINDRGQVAGLADVAGDTHLFLWDRDNGMQDLGPALGDNPDINNTGQIAATMIDQNGNERAFFWDPNDGRQMVGTFDGSYSIALALNNRGQLVGSFNPAEGLPPQPFVWDKTNGMRSLSQDGRQSGKAIAINDSGQVMGFVGQGPTVGLCFWDSTDPTDTPAPPLLPPDDYPGGSDLNNNGYVLGKGYRWDKDEEWTYLWTKRTGIEGIEYLFPLESQIGPLVFNDANQVLYSKEHTSSLERLSKKYFPSYTQLCLWDPKRGKIVLDRQVPHEMGKLLHVEGINNKGCIVGTVRSKDLKHLFGVLLEPIPERWGK